MQQNAYGMAMPMQAADVALSFSEWASFCFNCGLLKSEGLVVAGASFDRIESGRCGVWVCVFKWWAERLPCLLPCEPGSKWSTISRKVSPAQKEDYCAINGN